MRSRSTRRSTISTASRRRCSPCAIRHPAIQPWRNTSRICCPRAGFEASLDPKRGLDHGAWVPLALMYPAHDIPVLQLSIQTPLGPQHHLLLGRALDALRRDDVLVIGSGSFTHNLGRLRRVEPGAAPAADVVAFADWMHAALHDNRIDDLLAYRSKAPYAAMQHPTDEHLLPLFVALGAAGTRHLPRGCTPAPRMALSAWMPTPSAEARRARPTRYGTR